MAVETRSQARRRRMWMNNARRHNARIQRWIKQYKRTDIAHRHRLDDAQPKGISVKAHTRRK